MTVDSLDLDTLRKVADTTRDGLSVADARAEDMPLLYVNPAFEAMTGYSEAEVLGRNCRFLQGDEREQSGLSLVRRSLAAGEPCLVTVRNFRKNGEMFFNELSLSPLTDRSGELTHYVGIQRDVTSRVVREQLVWERGAALEVMNKELKRLATVDELTRLQNRRMFDMTLNREWRRARRGRARLSLFMIDIDNFKALNDDLGQPVGDACLRRVGAALSRVFSRAADHVARYGGDEFVVLSADLDTRAAVRQGERILESVRELDLPDTDRVVTVSVGIATAAISDEMIEQDLMAAADTALYRAKNAGRDGLDLIEVPGAERD